MKRARGATVAKQRASGSKRPAAPRRRRLLPERRGARLAVYATVVLGYVALMWFVVFPWVDRTFVNRPAL